MSELLDIATSLPDGPTTASRSKRSSSTRPRPRFAPTRARSSPSPEQSLRVSVFGSSSTASRATPMPAPSTTRRCRRPSARPATTPRSPNPTSSTVSPCPMASNQRRSNCGGHRRGVPDRGQDRPGDRARAGGARSRNPDLGYRVGRIHRHCVRVGGCHLDGYRRCGPRDRLLRLRVHARRSRRRDPDRFRVLDRPRPE